MKVRFDRLSDILSVKSGDTITRSERFSLFTGNEVGNTPQKGINWLGIPPNFLQIIARCAIHSGYSDRWIDQDSGIFLYYLMVSKRGTIDAKINYSSIENISLLDQRKHGAPILLMIDKDSNLLEIQGRFEVITHCQDNPIHPGIDSVLLRKVSD